MPHRPPKSSRFRQTLHLLPRALILWLILAYGLLPLTWRLYERTALPAVSPLLTRTGADIPGDPINLALIGSADDLRAALTAAGWHQADPLTPATTVRLALRILTERPYDSAPVSRLTFLSRPQDLAFEKPIGHDPDRRHHVRLWQIPSKDPAAPPVWLGAASEDISIGLNHLTGQFTHHIAPNIDAERDGLLADLSAAGRIGPIHALPGSGATKTRRNGEHDPYETDGLIRSARLRPAP